jgi:hypothetical protein
MRTRLATPALLLVGVLLFAACGGDDDDAGGILNRSATTVKESDSGSGAQSADTKDATDESDTTADDASSDDTATTDSGSASDESDTTIKFSGKGSGDFCDFAKDVENDVNLDDIGSDSASPADLEKQFKQARDVINEAVDKAPSEIKSDVKTIAEFFTKFDDLLSGYDYDFTKLAQDAQNHPEKLQELEQLTDDSDFQAATQRFDAYLEQECGITTTS